MKRAENVKHVVDELRPWWPSTLRQIYYRLVADGKIKNTRSDYILLSKLVKWMRIGDMIPWECLEDRSRRITSKKGYADIQEYVESERELFCNGYSRCLIQGQDRHVEVWVEKDALMGIFEEVVWPYCIRAVVCKGYQSVSFIADFYKRAEKALRQGQEPVVLYFGDLDPSGVQMMEASIETLEKEMGLCGVRFKRAGLNLNQVLRYNLPHNPDALKRSDPRAKKYRALYGDIAVELDALHPEILETLIKRSIENEVDMELFNQQKELEIKDQKEITTIRTKVVEVLQTFNV